MLPRLLAGVCFVALVGCGGSSSETPPPLEPDFQHGAPRSGSPAPPGSTTRPAPEGNVTEPAADTVPPSTWGEGDGPAEPEPPAE
jgi:hypothetical protein